MFGLSRLHTRMSCLYWCVCLLSFALLNMAVYVDGSYCSTGQSKPGDPSLPDINVTALVIEYQINILDRQYTMWAREDYDYLANKVRITMNKSGREEGIIMDYNDNLIVTYWYDNLAKSTYSCSIEQLNTSKSDNFNVFGGVRPVSRGSIPHIYSSRDVFRFDSSLGETYLGNTTIDGVPVDHWQSCMYWADDRDNFTLDYYFTTPDWTPIDPNSPVQIPLRAVVTGVKDTGSGTNYTFQHVYEYLNFRVFSRLPEENFALPTNMKCADTKGLRKKSLPSIPSRMSYTVEIVDGDTRMVDVLFDESRRLIRSLEKNVVSIDDFNTGVHYSINQTTQICSTRPISASVDSDAVNSTTFVILKGRQELFYLDGDFMYTGQADVRGIRCDSWVCTKVIQGVNSNVEVYFSVTSENLRSSYSGQVLVSLTVSTNNNNNIVTYNFFNQVSNPDISTNPFDITACRNESSMSPVQVHWSDLEVDEVNKQLHWLGSFLAPDPDSTRAHVANSTLPVSPLQALSILQQLNNDGKFVATVTLPPQGTAGSIVLNISALEIRDLKNDVDFTDDSDISLGHFIFSNNVRVADFAPEESVYSTSALSCADKCVQRSVYECTSFSYCFSARQCQLSSKRWNNATKINTSGCNFYIRDFTSDFMKIPGKTLQPADLEPTLEVSSIQTCANLCLEETAFECESFDYCESSQACYLGRYHYYEASPSDAYNSTLCDHYSRNYIADYSKSWATALVVNNSSQIHVPVVDDSSPIHCAYTCSKDVADCVRFSFCSSTQQCQTVTTPFVRSIKTQPSSACDVYTLTSAQQTTGPGSSSSTDTDSNTYSSGSMAGLAIAMIIVGIILCVGIALILQRFRICNLF